MNISIYGHGGSANHGNEAIVRGVSKLLNDYNITLYSFMPENDKKFELNKVCEIKPHGRIHKRYTLEHIILSLLFRLSKGKMPFYKYWVMPLLKNINGIYLLEAGDQYCENGFQRKLYSYLNKKITNRGGKTVMLGCTVNEEYLEDKKVLEDLSRYSLIVARESITYDALRKAGITKNTVLAPCPAFAMESEKCELPEIFTNDVVGINVGFLSQNNEKYYDLLVKNCEKLIGYILNKTNYSIALIPHVNWNPDLSDFKTLNLLYEKYKTSDRIGVVNEHSAPRQKYIMSKCRFMIALRTHVCVPSIAAQVPTLVTGYKVKSTGIVRDIFPEDYKLLAHLQSLKTEDDFTQHFIWMQENETKIREYMKEHIPDYIEKTHIIRDEITKLISGK